DHRDGGGLTGTVGTEKPVGLPRLDMETDTIHCHQVAETLPEAVDGQHLTHVITSLPGGSGYGRRPGTLGVMGRYVEFDATRLYRVDHGGEGAPIVLIHGLGGSAHDWDAVAPALTELGRVVAIDLPRFGYSPPTKIAGLRGMTGSVVAFLEEITEETGMKAVLFGNSMGGLISTFAAAERPDLVSSMVLVAPAFPPRLRDLPAVHRPIAIRLALHAAPVPAEALDAWLCRRRHRARVALPPDRIAHKAGRGPLPDIDILAQLAVSRRGLASTRRDVTTSSRSLPAFCAWPARLVEAVRRL